MPVTDQATPSTCPDCGALLPDDSPQELCPACLLRQALVSRTVVSGDPQPASPPPSPEEIAGKFPQFEITECLGRGGMGVVYKARQRSLKRWVAIKILAPERVGEEKFAERFTREAQTLAQLNHPNIVTVFDYGQTDGLYYIVMEFVDGVNLRDLLRDGKLEPEQALAIVPPVCEALQYAHDKKIVHRDIKPENLLLDRDGRIKIADFGIASLIGASGERSGTPPYMAPEQNGESGNVDHRADIFALGVVLYEMLTGERPKTDLAPNALPGQSGARIEEMVQRAMEQDPAERFQSAGEFQTMATRAAADRNIHSAASSPPTPPTIPPPRPRGMFRRWWWVIPIVILIGPVLGLVAGGVWIYTAPKKYVSKTVIQVTPDPTLPANTFTATQVAMITSRETFRQVSERLDLPKRWLLTEEEILSQLGSLVSVEPLRGTDLISIEVKHSDPADAADIANSIGTVYGELLRAQRTALEPDSTQIPKAPVTIHEMAMAPSNPPSPRIPFIVIAIALFAGLLLFPLLALLLMAVLQKLFPEKQVGR